MGNRSDVEESEAVAPMDGQRLNDLFIALLNNLGVDAGTSSGRLERVRFVSIMDDDSGLEISRCVTV